MSRRTAPAAGGSSLSRVRVAVRVRPPVGNDSDSAAARCLEDDVGPEGGSPSVVRYCHDNVHKSFAFDHVFSSAATQEDVYARSLRPFLASFLNGFNVTVMAYGQTGAGKTFTVGHHATLSPCPSPETPRSGDKDIRVASPEDGLIPRFLIDLFEALRMEPSVKAIHVSFLEVYCDELHDLLSNARSSGGAGHARNSMGAKPGAVSDRPLVIRDDEHRVTVQNLTQIQVETAAKALELMNIGRARQVTGSNALNSQSSRSHAIYTVEVSRTFLNDSKYTKLTFVDLAGNERLNKTNVQGVRMKESIQINVELLALSKVINALRDDRAQKRRQSVDSSGMGSDTASHVPYRSSKLTRLLRDGLGGNSMSLLIACVSPTSSNSHETLCTLQFADRASCIENKAQKNVEAVCPNGSSSPRRLSSPRSAASSPRSSFRGRSASEVEIGRLQEQVLMLKQQLDMATASPAEGPVQCTTYESTTSTTTNLPESKLTQPRASGLDKSCARREPDATTTVVIDKKPSAAAASASDSSPRSASISKLRNIDGSPGCKATGAKPSMLVPPRIRLSDRSPPHDATNASADSLQPSALAKPPRPSIAMKLFIQRLDAKATVQRDGQETRVKPKEESAGSCIDQQAADNGSDGAELSLDATSTNDAKPPAKEDDAQPQSVDADVVIKSLAQKPLTHLAQPHTVQVRHGRRRSSPSAFAIHTGPSKLQAFMESLKLPILLPSRERSDFRSPSLSPPSRSPRSSPSSPSSASTSSVSPMSVRRQSLASPTTPFNMSVSGGTIKSALRAFVEKVKPNGMVVGVGPPSSCRQCEDMAADSELTDVEGESHESASPQRHVELKEEPCEENAEATSADEGQFEQESSPVRSHSVQHKESESPLPCLGSEPDCGDDCNASTSTGPLAEVELMADECQPKAHEAQRTFDAVGEPTAAGLGLPAIHGEEELPVAQANDDTIAPTSSFQHDAEQQHEVLAEGIAEECAGSDATQASVGCNEGATPSTSSESDATSSNPLVDITEPLSTCGSGSVQGCDVMTPSPSITTTAILAPVEAVVAPYPRFYGPIYHEDPLELDDIRLPTVDQGTQCEDLPPLGDSLVREEAAVVEEPAVAPADFVVDRRHWREDVRRHFLSVRERQSTNPRRQRARDTSRVHPFKWFAFPASSQLANDPANDHDGNNNGGRDDVLGETHARRLEQLLGEMRQLVGVEIGQGTRQNQTLSLPAKHFASRSANNNDLDGQEDDDGAQRVTLQTFVEDAAQLLDARAQCQRRVLTLKRQVDRLAGLLGSLPTLKQLPLGCLGPLESFDTVAGLTEAQLGSFTLGHQDTLLRAALVDGESQVAARLRVRVQHFHQAVAGGNALPPELFLSRSQYEACRSGTSRELLPLVLSGWISVTRAAIDAEASWLDL